MVFKNGQNFINIDLEWTVTRCQKLFLGFKSEKFFRSINGLPILTDSAFAGDYLYCETPIYFSTCHNYTIYFTGVIIIGPCC